MKKLLPILLILPFLFWFNIGFTQNNSGLDSSKDLTLTLREITPNEFITGLGIGPQEDASFFTLAVYIDAPFSGNLKYQLDNTEWQPLPRYHEATRTDREIFDLLFLPNKGTNIRFKSDQNIPSGLKARGLILGTTNNHSTSATLREDCTCPQPDICGRDCWCPDGNCPTDATPFATAPSHIIVHHSASASTSNDFPAVVRSYWDFHVTVNGWDDIGYNWLIDGEGVIYEGRGSGMQGAHFSCMNSETTGICMIGNFENSTPTTIAINSLENLITWEACDKTIVPADSSNHVTSGSLLAHISGHRDGNDLPNSCTNTVCPGENLYPLLPGIRERVTEKPCLNDLVPTQEIEASLFQIFPNPSNGHFQLSGELNQIATVQVYGQTGQMISFDFHQNGLLEIQQTGLFILKIIRKNGSVSTHKFLVGI